MQVAQLPHSGKSGTIHTGLKTGSMAGKHSRVFSGIEDSDK